MKRMPIPHVLHMKEIIPESRRTNNCGRHMSTSGPDVHNSHASNINIATLTVAKNQIKIDSMGLQAECWYEQEELPQA